MNRRVIATLFAAALSAVAMPVAAADLWITVRAPDPMAEIRVMIFASEASFAARSDAWAMVSVKPSEGGARFALADPPAGPLAVAAFQDMDGNGKLDFGLFGSPTEPTGFSGGPFGGFRPPTFADAAFVPDGAPVVVILR